MPSQTFKWKTHLVRHKQTMHGNEPPPPKKGKQLSFFFKELINFNKLRTHR